MPSVTHRIKQIKQPRGGYIKPTEFEQVKFNDGVELSGDENIHASLIGLAVDYLTRVMIGSPAESAFRISLRGAAILGDSEYSNAAYLTENVTGLDAESVISACQLSGYDVCFRAGVMGYRPVEDIVPNEKTIGDIKTMVERSLAMLKKYGPIVMDGFTMMGGYTNLVDTGDGDFLTEDTLWDFKVSKNPPNKDHTLQLLMYYLMGIHSIHDEFQSVDRIGVFNPKLNTVWIKNIDTIDPQVINEVSSDVIGY